MTAPAIPALDGARVRLESVQNAIDQAKHAALAMIGKPAPYREVPWFWSDQYDIKLQIAGLVRPGDVCGGHAGSPSMREILRVPSARRCCRGVEAVNAAPDYIVGRKLIANRAQIDPERLADTGVPAKQLA